MTPPLTYVFALGSVGTLFNLFQEILTQDTQFHFHTHRLGGSCRRRSALRRSSASCSNAHFSAPVFGSMAERLVTATLRLVLISGRKTVQDGQIRTTRTLALTKPTPLKVMIKKMYS